MLGLRRKSEPATLPAETDAAVLLARLHAVETRQDQLSVRQQKIHAQLRELAAAAEALEGVVATVSAALRELLGILPSAPAPAKKKPRPWRYGS